MVLKLWQDFKPPYRPSKNEIKFWQKVVKKVVQNQICPNCGS